ncbi:interleukin-15 [Pempheris klunzingeri]|uniref:interleukin-15 n=1 Tax=Pempheris klunzingeri TaxID=3127111 RepID=UPI0039802C93
MTDFMTALLVILFQPTCPGDKRAKGVPFQLTCNLCQERHTIQVWLCFLVLSFLSTSTYAASTYAPSLPDTEDVQICLERLIPAIKKSDAMLYAPLTKDEDCKIMSLSCYMLELIMVIIEEEIDDNTDHCILEFNENLPHEANSVSGCPPCETYSLQNITVFLDSLKDLLKEMTIKYT